MNLNKFHSILIETGQYETLPKPAKSLGDHLFGWSDAWYYGGLARIIVSGGCIAHGGKYDAVVWAYQSLAMLKVAESCGGRISITGLKNLSEIQTPVVFISNHMSMLETFLLPAILSSFRGLAIVVKESLIKYPFFGKLLCAIDPIIVTRKSPRDDLKTVLVKGEETLRNGRSVLVFPQATRSQQFDPDHFNTLGNKLAQKAKVPVVPIALKTDFQSIGRILRDIGPINRRKKIHIKVGPPLTIDGNNKEVHYKVTSFIAGSLKEWSNDQ